MICISRTERFTFINEIDDGNNSFATEFQLSADPS